MKTNANTFFGANHSFNPTPETEWPKLGNNDSEFLHEGYLFLDIPVGLAEELLEGPSNEFDNFIPTSVHCPT